MKRFGVIAVVLLIAFAFTSMAIAKDKPMEHKGTISKIDLKAKTFSMKDDKGVEITMIVEDDKILKTLEGLKVGDKVVCKHIVKAGKNICQGVIKKKPIEGC